MENMHRRKRTSGVINRRIGMTSSCFPYTGIRSSGDNLIALLLCNFYKTTMTLLRELGIGTLTHSLLSLGFRGADGGSWIITRFLENLGCSYMVFCSSQIWFLSPLTYFFQPFIFSYSLPVDLKAYCVFFHCSFCSSQVTSLIVFVFLIMGTRW